MPAQNLSRRQLLSSAAAATAGLAFMREFTIAADDPIAAVVDKASAIKLAKLTTHIVGPKAFVRLDTNQQIHGWGEITGLDPVVGCELARSLFELLDGENPTRIEHLWQKLYRAHRDIRGGPFMTHVISGIDMALWDITGKLHGVPVYRLLGGPTRDRIRMYPTAKAFKVPSGGPQPYAGTPQEIQRYVKNIAEWREKVGPDGIVMFDAHCALPPPFLIQLAGALEPYNVFWIEEPAVPGNIEVFKRLKAAIKIPLATGERDRTIWGMIPYLQERCIDILQPDVGHTGGITQMKKIATIAEAYNVPLAPHNTGTHLSLTASLHAVAAIPNFLIEEGYPDGHIMPEVARKNWTIDKDGYASLPQGPGLGIEMDLQAMADLNADPKRKYKWPVMTLKDGSISDY
jgi:galactonate dehydratase